MGNAFIGIDPGASGGICIKWHGGTAMAPMEVNMEGRCDGVWLARFIRELSAEYKLDPIVFLEKVWGMPGQGSTSIFSFGHAMGTIETTLHLIGLKYTHVTPMAWKKEFGLVTPKDSPLSNLERKKLAIPVAMKIFPGFTFIASKRSREPHMGMVDAALICEYGRLKSPVSLF